MNKFTIDNQLAYPRIGHGPKGQNVSCSIQLHQRKYRFHHQNYSGLAKINWLFNKQLHSSFKSIQNYHPHPPTISYQYLPKALNEGNAAVMTKYLTMLQNKNINSYINFNIPFPTNKANLLASKLHQILYRKYFHAFKTIKNLNYSKITKRQTQKPSLISRKQLLHQIETVPLITTKKQSIKVTYERIYLSSSKQKSNYNHYQHLNNQGYLQINSTKKNNKKQNSQKQYGKKIKRRVQHEIQQQSCQYCKDSPISKITTSRPFSMYQTSQTFLIGDGI